MTAHGQQGSLQNYHETCWKLYAKLVTDAARCPNMATSAPYTETGLSKTTRRIFRRGSDSTVFLHLLSIYSSHVRVYVTAELNTIPGWPLSKIKRLQLLNLYPQTVTLTTRPLSSLLLILSNY